MYIKKFSKRAHQIYIYIYIHILNVKKVISFSYPLTTAICPIGFAWHENVAKYYLAEVKEDIDGNGVREVYKELHPSATPFEQRNKAQRDTVMQIAVKGFYPHNHRHVSKF